MIDPTYAKPASRRRPWSGARLGGLAMGLALPLAFALPAAAQDAPPPPDDIAATVAACLSAGVDFSDCVDATVAELLPLLEASVPFAVEGAPTEPPPPPVPVFVLPPLPLPLPPILGGATEDGESADEATEVEVVEDESADDVASEDEAAADGLSEDETTEEDGAEGEATDDEVAEDADEE